MPLTKLVIEFGGLCMFVENPNEPKGLFVLMPKMEMIGMMHCQMVRTKGANMPDGKDYLLPFAGGSVDWRSLAQEQAPGAMPAMALDISGYAGTNVDEKWLSDAPPADCLAARVILPFGSKVETFGESGLLQVLDRAPAPFVGQARVTIDVTEARDTLEIAGMTLSPVDVDREGDVDSVIQVEFLNVPRSELDGIKPRVIEGVPVHHVQAYYTLLEGSCDSNRGGPAILAAQNRNGDVDISAFAKSCPTEPEPIENPLDGAYIDPLNCTVSFGRPPRWPK